MVKVLFGVVWLLAALLWVVILDSICLTITGFSFIRIFF